MSVTIRPYRKGGWEVDIRVVSPDGTRHKRERKHAPISSRTAVGRWAAARERVLFERLLSPPKDQPRKEVPTLQEFARVAKAMILRLYLIPAFGRKHLDAIKSEDVQRLKAQLEVKSPKTVNNILAVLSILLKKAVEWDVIERMPCRIKLLPIRRAQRRFTTSRSTSGSARTSRREGPESDPGSRRACGSDDDPALHAPQPGSPRRGDRRPGTGRPANKVVKICWQRGVRCRNDQ
jgi:hypothetical protein